jgi:hypothetical protein
MRVTMLLADAAQEVNGKLYVLGGGWSITGPEVGPMALAIKIDVPWSAANQTHRFSLDLVSEDGQDPEVQSPDGTRRTKISFDGEFEVGRPPGIPPGTDIDTAFAIQLGPLPLVRGRGYVWRLFIDGDTHDHWQRQFRIRN